MKKYLIFASLIGMFFSELSPMKSLEDDQESLAYLAMEEDPVATVSRVWQYLQAGMRLEVDFSNQHLTGFRDVFFKELDGVVVFNLSGNQIKRLPGSIASIKTLKKLDVSGNPLERTAEMQALRRKLVAQGVEVIGWQ